MAAISHLRSTLRLSLLVFSYLELWPMSLVPTAKNGLDRLLRLFIIAYQRRTQEPTRGARRTEARALGHGRYKHVINVSIERAFSSRFQFCNSASYRSICVRVQSSKISSRLESAVPLHDPVEGLLQRKHWTPTQEGPSPWKHPT